uniref:Laminin N-terminal domain-containing protein n=1 Tax=Ditylenchus dipsaci TaxID=166011 RepID=A0A915EBL9_9BILA
MGLSTTSRLLLGWTYLTVLFAVVLMQPAEREPKYDPNHYRPSDNPCYDERNQPQRCVPDFINAAFNLEVEVTNTCGERQPTRFCVQTGHMVLRRCAMSATPECRNTPIRPAT